MTRDERTELEELLPILADSATQDRVYAQRWRSATSGGTSHETKRMHEARRDVADLLDRLAEARMAYRAEIKRALDGR